MQKRVESRHHFMEIHATTHVMFFSVLTATVSRKQWFRLVKANADELTHAPACFTADDVNKVKDGQNQQMS